MANAFDLGNGGDADQTNVGFGAHLGYLRQRQGGSLVFGFEADVTALFGGEETISETAAFNRPSDIRNVGSGAGSGAGANVLPFSTSSDTAGSYYRQSVDIDTEVLSSLRAKIGVARRIYFPYLTAGVALAHYSVNAQSSLQLSAEDLNRETGVSLSSSKSFDETAVGGVVGGGISMALKNAILSVEGLYYFFDDKVDVSSGFLNSAQRNEITFDNIAEVRFKVSVPLN